VAGDLSQFNGTINLVASSNPADEVIVPAGSAAYNLPATATWNIASGQTLAFVGSGTDNATVILNGPGNTVGFGALRLDSLVTQAGNVLLAGTNNGIGSFGGTPTISGIIMDSGSGKGVVIVARANSSRDTIVFSGANTYSGTTTLINGTLQVASAEIPGTSGPLGSSTISFAGGDGTSNFGTLQYSSANQFDYSSRFSTAAGQKYNIDVNGQTVTFATPLTSSGGVLTLTDTASGGTLTLTATNTYSGGTTIAAGTLDVSSGSILGGVTVTRGTLQLDNPSSLSLGTILTLVSGATVNLTYSGNQRITDLFVDGAEQAPGVYGTGANNPNGSFIGSGTLTVIGKSPTTVSAVSIDGNHQLAISWASVPGANYNVYSTTNLGQPILWTLVNSSPILATGTTTSYTLPGSIAGQPQLFVRVGQ
jgi:autotransporter-associated beta strand protein